MEETSLIWSQKRFLFLVGEVFGSEQVEKTKIYTSSFNRKLTFTRFHAEEIRRIYEEFLTKNKISKIPLITHKILLSAGDPKNNRDFYETIFMIEANIIAYAQAFHSLADILSHIIFYGLGIENYNCSFNKESISIKKVKDFINEYLYSDLINIQVDNLINCNEFKYLESFVNTTKHRSLVETKHSIEFTNPEKYGVKIYPFNYKGTKYQKKWSEDFITKDFEIVLDRLISIGNSINNCLENNLSSKAS